MDTQYAIIVIASYTDILLLKHRNNTYYVIVY